MTSRATLLTPLCEAELLLGMSGVLWTSQDTLSQLSCHTNISYKCCIQYWQPTSWCLPIPPPAPLARGLCRKHGGTASVVASLERFQGGQLQTCITLSIVPFLLFIQGAARPPPLASCCFLAGKCTANANADKEWTKNGQTPPPCTGVAQKPTPLPAAPCPTGGEHICSSNVLAGLVCFFTSANANTLHSNALRQ